MTETKTKNPLIQPYDYLKGYRDSIDNLKNKPEYVQFDRLCYELFEGSEIGRKFMEHVVATYLIPHIVPPYSTDYSSACIWAEGFKSALRLLLDSTRAHSQRIKAETNQ